MRMLAIERELRKDDLGCAVGELEAPSSVTLSSVAADLLTPLAQFLSDSAILRAEICRLRHF